MVRFFMLVLTSVAMSAVAQLLLKLGVGRAQGAGDAAPASLLAMLTSPLVIAGLGLYGLGAILWLYVLARAPLSVAYPFVGAGFILTAMLGAAVLGEQVSIARWIGIALIVAGCTLVARTA
jgi:multidrug transporter EmrE-like cation transporter